MEASDGPLIVEEFTNMAWGFIHNVVVVTRSGQVLERREFPPDQEHMWADNVKRRPTSEWWPWFKASAVPCAKDRLTDAELGALREGVARVIAAGESMGPSFNESRDGGMYATMAVAEDGTMVGISLRGDFARLSRHADTRNFEHQVSRILDDHADDCARCFFRYHECSRR
jgi:hypothetical protein